MTSETRWWPEHPGGHQPYCVSPFHSTTSYSAAAPSEPGTMAGQPSKAWLADHPERESVEAEQDRIEAAVAAAEASPFLRLAETWTIESAIRRVAHGDPGERTEDARRHLHDQIQQYVNDNKVLLASATAVMLLDAISEIRQETGQ